ncbi:MAG: hypothetical protein Q9213_000940 [Squamulea squamosa]
MDANGQTFEGRSRLGTEYNNVYSLSNGLMAAYDNYKSNNERLYWSDVAFAIWTEIASLESKSPMDIRHIARSKIYNKFTSSIINAAMAQMPSKQVSALKPGDEAFLAMLGTPNGAGGVHLLMQHKQVLGLKTISKVFIGYDGPRLVNPFIVYEVTNTPFLSQIDISHVSGVCSFVDNGENDPSIHDSAILNTGVTANSSSTYLRNVALTFGRQDHVFNFSLTQDGPLFKRTVDPDFHNLVCKGRTYYQQGVLPAFDGHSAFATPGFTAVSFQDNGWRRIDQPDEPLPQHWKPAFSMIPEGKPADDDEESEGEARDADVTQVYMDQRLPFTNAQGQLNTPPTGAKYYAMYLPEACAIITSVSYSPTSEMEDQGLDKSQIASRIPPLHQLSDVLWAVWESFVYAPGNLRYYAVEGILNEASVAFTTLAHTFIPFNVSQPLMDDIFHYWRETLDVPWENRLTFDLDSEEGAALFASPNGIAAAWLLIHRAGDIGRRTPRVTIFNPGGANRCMIWDLIPQGVQGAFGEPLHEDEEMMGTTGHRRLKLLGSRFAAKL